ncbi:MFS transporter [Rhodocista pekingensis]|uniref:MFS transporter n=1 Tax=Rhodocista pekingensis TaxID=201185 RepID=A0ABW2KU20_9PROT
MREAKTGGSTGRSTGGGARLSAGRLLAYGLPALPLAALTLPAFALVPKYYAGLGLPLGAVGLAILLARLWDVVTDPLVGWLSDRTRGRFGRRRPWLVAGLPLVLLSVWMLFQPPAGAGIAHLTGWSFALYLGWSMMFVPYTAWGAELSGDYDERTRIAAWRDVLFLAGSIAAPVLVTAAGAGEAGREGAALLALAVFILAALPASVLLAVLAVPEPDLPPTRPSIGLRRGWVVLVRNGPFRRLLLAYFLNGLANGLPGQLFLFYAEHVLGEGERAGILLLAYLVPGLLAVPLWLALSRRFGKHRVWSWAMLWACGWFALVPFLGPGDFAGFLAVCLMTGAVLGADLVLPGAMQADVVDHDTVRTGTPRTGLYFALWGLAWKLALALSALGLTTAGLFGFADRPGNPPEALLALTAIYSLLPILFKLGAVALLWHWPVTAEVQADLRRRIEARRARSQPQLQPSAPHPPHPPDIG